MQNESALYGPFVQVVKRYVDNSDTKQLLVVVALQVVNFENDNPRGGHLYLNRTLKHTHPLVPD
jgi:hypothetical protein